MPLFSRCLFCHRPFPEHAHLPHLPPGRRIAYDPVLGRLWSVCEACHRWNLCPIEERDAALYALERMARDRGHMLAHTANVSLLEAPPFTLIRIGQAGLTEQAWWRYGRELVRRRASYESIGSKLTAATFGTMAYLGDVLCLNDGDYSIDWKDTPFVDIMRWRRFGWAAWHGRETCPFCNSTLRALRYELSWWVYPLLGPDGRLGVGVPCQRCDPWTPEKVYELRGEGAEMVLRRLLAYQNIGGASEKRIGDAALAIEHAGSAGEFTAALNDRRETLWRMGSTKTVALEIALNETVERRMLSLEVRALEFLWKQEEELARIIDEELTPRRLLEAHLRRLPIRVGPRHAPSLLPDMEGALGTSSR